MLQRDAELLAKLLDRDGGSAAIPIINGSYAEGLGPETKKKHVPTHLIHARTHCTTKPPPPPPHQQSRNQPNTDEVWSEKGYIGTI